MKNILTLLLTFLCGNQLFAGTDVDSSNYIGIEGKVFWNKIVLKDYEVLVYEENDSLFKFTVPGKGFSVDLERDKIYTIQISKGGYFVKRIMIDTKVDRMKKDEVYEIGFEASLISTIEGVDPYYLDFPSTIIRYDRNAEEFKMSEKYTNHIQSKVRTTKYSAPKDRPASSFVYQGFFGFF